MTASALQTKTDPIRIERADSGAPILIVTGPGAVAIRAGTVVVIGAARFAFEEDIPVSLPTLAPGTDYGVRIEGGGPVAVAIGADMLADGATFAGFHFAASGNAQARRGGDGIPAINPFSLWDHDWRPACRDPRGMALVDGRFWADIYLLGVDHPAHGTSRAGVTIATGRNLPARPGGKGKCARLDYAAAVDIYGYHGKSLLGAEEFFAAAHGVAERASRSGRPELTGETDDDAMRFVSRWGLFDATGTMWQWGTDGDPDDPRASIFGGSWLGGSGAGSRCADLGCWPDASDEDLSARGRSDHLKPA
jgi:hypothetical protein